MVLLLALGVLMALSMGVGLCYLFAGGRAAELFLNADRAASLALPGAQSGGLAPLRALGCNHVAVAPFAELYPLPPVRAVIGEAPEALGVGPEVPFVLCMLPSDLDRIPSCSEVAIHYARATRHRGPVFVLVRDPSGPYCADLRNP